MVTCSHTTGGGKATQDEDHAAHTRRVIVLCEHHQVPFALLAQPVDDWHNGAPLRYFKRPTFTKIVLHVCGSARVVVRNAKDKAVVGQSTPPAAPGIHVRTKPKTHLHIDDNQGTFVGINEGRRAGLMYSVGVQHITHVRHEDK